MNTRPSEAFGLWRPREILMTKRPVKKAVKSAPPTERWPAEPIEVHFATDRDVTGPDHAPQFGKGVHPKDPSDLRFG
jgi:hypothetical protein